MFRHLGRYTRAFLLTFSIVAGTVAVAYDPRPAHGQTGPVTCWAESCVENVCVRVKIKCPPVIEPVT